MTASMASYALDFYWDRYFNPPARIFQEMRNSLKGKMGGKFFTGCICSMNIETGTISMSAAGHPSAIIIRDDGTAEMKHARGRLINEFFEPNSENISITLNRGDRIILYTDGISEAQDPEGTMIGVDDEKLSSWIKECSKHSASPGEQCENIYKEILLHTGSSQLSDDFTLLVLEYTFSP